jgi:hypothetical protein
MPAMAVLLPVASVYLLTQTEMSLGMRIDAVFMIAVGVFFAWISVMFFRTWYSILTKYTVDISGITIEFFSHQTRVTWGELMAAQYRKSLGQLELKFKTSSRLVVLTNVDLNWERNTVLSACRYVEESTSVELRKTVL